MMYKNSEQYLVSSVSLSRFYFITQHLKIKRRVRGLCLVNWSGPYLTNCIFLAMKHSCNESLMISKYRRGGWLQRTEFYFIPLKTDCHITYFWKWKEWRRMHNASVMGWTKGIHFTGIHAELLVSYWTMYQSAFFKRPTDRTITLIYWPIILTSCLDCVFA